MNYFKNKNNEIFAYDNEQVINGYGSDLTPITEAEKEELLKPTAEQLKAAEVAKIEARLKEIDSLSIRPLRAIAAGTAVQFDTDKLTALESEREQLVLDLTAINAG